MKVSLFSRHHASSSRHTASARRTPLSSPKRPTLHEWTMSALREEYVASGRARLFEHLQNCLARDESALSYAEIAAQLKLTEAAIKMAVQRLRNRYRELLRREIAETVSTAAEVEEELRHLFAAFGG